MLLLCVLPHSAVNVSETPVVATVEKKEYVYETKEEAKQAFKELLREKASLMYGPVIQCNTRNNQRLWSTGDNDRRSKLFFSDTLLCLSFMW